MNEKINVCLMNDSFPPLIDGVANTVVNYASIIEEKYGHAIVSTPDYPGVTDNYPFEVMRYPSINTTKLVGYRAGMPLDVNYLTRISNKDIDIIQLPNGQTGSEANLAASREIERIYADSWRRGVSVPFFDNDGNTYLANPDGSEDRVALDRRSRTYRIIRRTAAPGKGRYSYLISR